MDAFPLTRRQLLLGAAGGLVLTACGKSDGTDDEGAIDEGDGEGTTTTVAGGLTLVRLFAPQQPLGTDVRLALALADAEGTFDVETPDEVMVRLRRPDGTMLPAQTAALHTQDLPRGYYPVRTNFDVAGRWGIEVEAGAGQVDGVVDVRPTGEIERPGLGVGDPLPRIATPIRGQKRGVERICTADRVCPFHRRSLDEVIGGTSPIALLIATPAFCQVAICGPVLDLVVQREEQLRAAGIEMIHVEPFADAGATTASPTATTLQLPFEPVLYLAAPDGTITERLDLIFDGAELDEALAKLEA